ncbi:uncharacterized protein GIQ15_05029 [Arthroderma uncinatum]|uniref:uncharacterized protein n=1 Tax=Arthroderma uncinatum TaxID=74035 RepID=UPI00144A8E27|nr:uncharacterized protein GIQ15_05029 [Arthroderma uncinatum]KAF3482270.1 hypothetical protein GIQ15_05029 [Arthroderma uncinatum]
MSTMRRYLSAEKHASIMEWVDNVNLQPCVGMTVSEPSKAAKQADTAPSPPIPVKRKRGRPPKYKQLTLESTRLRRVTVVPRGAQQKQDQEEDKAEEKGKEHVKKDDGVSKQEPESGKYGEDMGDKVKKEALSGHPVSSGKSSSLRMICVEIIVPSSEKHNSREKQACGEVGIDNDKRKRGVTKGRRGRPKYPRLDAEKG